MELGTWATRGLSLSGSGPSRTEPKAMMAASRSFQSSARMLVVMKGRTSCTTSSPTHWASSIIDTPAAFDGFQSSSSSCSSCTHPPPQAPGGEEGAEGEDERVW